MRKMERRSRFEVKTIPFSGRIDIKQIDGETFVRKKQFLEEYGKISPSERARNLAKEWRKKGYKARIIKHTYNYEVWVSEHKK